MQDRVTLSAPKISRIQKFVKNPHELNPLAFTVSKAKAQARFLTSPRLLSNALAWWLSAKRATSYGSERKNTHTDDVGQAYCFCAVINISNRASCSRRSVNLSPPMAIIIDAWLSIRQSCRQVVVMFGDVGWRATYT